MAGKKKSKGRSPYITGPGGSKAPTAPVKKGPGGTYITGPGGCEIERVPNMTPIKHEGVQRGGDKRPFITGPGGAQKKSSYPIELPQHNEYGANPHAAEAGVGLMLEGGPTTSEQPKKKKKKRKTWFGKKVRKTKGEGAIMRKRRQLEEALEYD